MEETWRKTLSDLPLEELKKARLFIDLLLLKIQKSDPDIEKELGLRGHKKELPKDDEGRKHRRHNVKYPCRYKIVGGPKDRLFQGHVLDISAGGCQVQLEKPLRVGETLQIDMKVSGQGVKTIIGQIKWIRVDPEGGLDKWLAGLEFIFDHP